MRQSHKEGSANPVLGGERVMSSPRPGGWLEVTLQGLKEDVKRKKTVVHMPGNVGYAGTGCSSWRLGCGVEGGSGGRSGKLPESVGLRSLNIKVVLDEIRKENLN